MSHHVTLSLHWLEAATVNSVTSLLFTEVRNGCEREGGRDTMREMDIERDRERMRKRMGGME